MPGSGLRFSPSSLSSFVFSETQIDVTFLFFLSGIHQPLLPLSPLGHTCKQKERVRREGEKEIDSRETEKETGREREREGTVYHNVLLITVSYNDTVISHF